MARSSGVTQALTYAHTRVKQKPNPDALTCAGVFLSIAGDGAQAFRAVC